MSKLSSGHRQSLSGIFFLAVIACAAPDEPDPDVESVVEAVLSADALAEPQATSLFGEPLFAKSDTAGVLVELDRALRSEPDDVELLIASARERRNLWQYRQAMVLYTRAAELAPEDWRPYRYRGHRHLSVREFDAGIADLQRAQDLAPLNWDVSYHLGLAYFLAGRFTEAAHEYIRCMAMADSPEAESVQSDSFRSCSQNRDDPESYVAMAEWAARALLRADRPDELGTLLDSIEEGWEIEENLAYYHDLLYHKGLLTEGDLLSGVEQGSYRLETVGYGIVNQVIAEGDTAHAVDILQTLVADPWWPGFGRLAAEAELVRLGAPQR
jgi:tetratricopeptide (TPR) repeat protein